MSLLPPASAISASSRQSASTSSEIPPEPSHAISDSLAQALEDMKICRVECKKLVGSCQELLLAATDLENETVARDINATVHRIYGRIYVWATYTRFISMLLKSDVQHGIDKSYQELQSSSLTLNVAFQMQFVREHKRAQEFRAKETAHFIDLISHVTQPEATHIIPPHLRVPPAFDGPLLPPITKLYEFAAQAEELTLDSESRSVVVGSPGSSLFSRSPSSFVTAPSSFMTGSGASPWSLYSVSPVK